MSIVVEQNLWSLRRSGEFCSNCHGHVEEHSTRDRKIHADTLTETSHCFCADDDMELAHAMSVEVRGAQEPDGKHLNDIVRCGRR